MTDCIFCKISKKEIPASVVYEDDICMAILDIMPANYGHILVLTKQHYETVIDVPLQEFSFLMKVILSLVKGIKIALGLEGFNLLQNNGKIAGQIIPHFHFHIIPRRNEDGVALKWKTLKYDDEDKQKEILNLIRAKIDTSELKLEKLR